MLMITSCSPQNTAEPYTWLRGATLPAAHDKPHLGLAGPMVGVLHGQLLIAGGANFPGAMPWDGGAKVYQDKAYLYDITADGELNYSGEQPFDSQIAYAAHCFAGDKLYSIGGERQGKVTAECSVYTLVDSVLQRTLLPELPIALSNASVLCLDQSLYLLGGEGTDTVSAVVYRLNLEEPLEWTEFAQLPYPVSHAMVAADEEGNILLAGGRKRNHLAKSTMYSAVWSLSSKTAAVAALPSLPYALAAGTAIYHKGQFVVFGGDAATVFHQVEALLGDIHHATDPQAREQLIAQKNALQRSHPGFDSTIWALDRKGQQWETFGSLPMATPVTTTALYYEQKVIIPSGEIRPGIRTDQILVAILR